MRVERARESDSGVFSGSHTEGGTSSNMSGRTNSTFGVCNRDLSAQCFTPSRKQQFESSLSEFAHQAQFLAHTGPQITTKHHLFL